MYTTWIEPSWYIRTKLDQLRNQLNQIWEVFVKRLKEIFSCYTKSWINCLIMDITSNFSTMLNLHINNSLYVRQVFLLLSNVQFREAFLRLIVFSCIVRIVIWFLRSEWPFLSNSLIAEEPCRKNIIKENESFIRENVNYPLHFYWTLSDHMQNILHNAGSVQIL